MRITADSDSEPCPVPDKMLGELYRANKAGLPELIATVSPAARAALALYCYRRGHLKSIGLAIASSCKRHDLETAGGAAGAALYARARELAPNSPAPSPYVARQKISLATGSLRKSMPIDQDAEEGDDDTPRASMMAANDGAAAFDDDIDDADTELSDTETSDTHTTAIASDDTPAGIETDATSAEVTHSDDSEPHSA